MGPVGVTGHLGFLPGAELGVGRAQILVDPRLQTAHFLGDVDVAAVGQVAQFGDLTFKLGDRLFEVEIGGHGGETVRRSKGLTVGLRRSVARGA